MNLTLTDQAGFGALGVPADLRDVLGGVGCSEPFTIQAAVIPDALAAVTDSLGTTAPGKTIQQTIKQEKQEEKGVPPWHSEP